MIPAVTQFEVAATLYAGLCAHYGAQRVRGGFTIKPASRRERGARVNVALLSDDCERISLILDCRRKQTRRESTARGQRAARIAGAHVVTVGGMDEALATVRALTGNG